MKDQFRSRRVALWLNLIPDLVRSGQLEDNDRSDILEKDYLTYRETLPLIPSIKAISLSKTKLQVGGNGLSRCVVGGRRKVIHQYESGAFSFAKHIWNKMQRDFTLGSVFFLILARDGSC